MDVLKTIILNVIMPLFSLIFLGAMLHRVFMFNMNTLSKLLTFVLMPAVGFINIYQSNIDGDNLVIIIVFLILQNVSLIALAELLSKLSKFNRPLSATFKNSLVLSNNGNFGIPVSQMVFQANPLGLSVQIIVLIFQNMLTYTYGLLNAVAADNTKPKQILKEFLKLPIIYAMLFGLLLKNLDIHLPVFLWNPIETLSNAFLAVALVTLGAQMAFLKLSKITFPLIMSTIGRLFISPIIGLMIILLMGLEGTTAQALFIASSFPSSRNSALFALEYNNHPELAAHAVLITTLLSILTVTVVVYLSKVIF